MNSIIKIFLAVAAGFDVLIRLMTPIVVVLFFISFVDMNEILSTILLVGAGLSSLFRAIKIGIFKLKEND